MGWGNHTDEPIEGFDPKAIDVCPCGGAHKYLLVHKTDKVEIIKCVACFEDSVVYHGDPWGSYGGLGAARRFWEG